MLLRFNFLFQCCSKIEQSLEDHDHFFNIHMPKLTVCLGRPAAGGHAVSFITMYSESIFSGWNLLISISSPEVG